MSNTDVDHQHILTVVKSRICSAFDNAVAADHRDDMIVLDQLGGDLRGDIRAPLIVRLDVVDRAAVYSAIFIDAFEKRVGCLG